MERNGHTYCHAQICRGIELLKSNVQRIAFRTSRLFVFAHTGNIDVFRNRLSKDLFGLGSIFWTHQQLDSTDQIRPEPVQANDILIDEDAIDPCRIQASLRQQRFRQISESADRHQAPYVEFAIGWRLSRWRFRGVGLP